MISLSHYFNEEELIGHIESRNPESIDWNKQTKNPKEEANLRTIKNRMKSRFIFISKILKFSRKIL